MGMWEAIVLIVAIVVIGKVMRGGRWNRETRRWEQISTENPYVRNGLIDEVPTLRKEIGRLNDRVATLEALAVDPARQLSDEIEQLRVRGVGSDAVRGEVTRRPDA